MCALPFWKSARIGLFRPFSAFFARFRTVRTAPGNSRNLRKKAFFLRFPPICLSPHLLNPHLWHSKLRRFWVGFRSGFCRFYRNDQNWPRTEFMSTPCKVFGGGALPMRGVCGCNKHVETGSQALGDGGGVDKFFWATNPDAATIAGDNFCVSLGGSRTSPDLVETAQMLWIKVKTVNYYVKMHKREWRTRFGFWRASVLRNWLFNIFDFVHTIETCQKQGKR